MLPSSVIGIAAIPEMLPLCQHQSSLQAWLPEYDVLEMVALGVFHLDAVFGIVQAPTWRYRVIWKYAENAELIPH